MALTPIHILRQYWKHDAFRPQQEAIIHSILEGQDTLALMPTGGGKSLCFQVPALIMDGLCLVITPLIALMKDQVLNLEQRGIPALAIHSGMHFYDVKKTLEKAAEGAYKFLYLSPERLETNLFKEYLPVLNITLIAVDEAHCVSQWGYDFRPSYLRIAALREVLPAVPVIALSASATPMVQEDIIEKLLFKNYNTFHPSFARPNISYSVFKTDSKINKAIDIIKNVPGSSIIYCNSRRICKEVTDLLLLEGISADFYHAGLLQEERNKRQESWMRNQTRVMVSTNAFGMGIDKPDVRTVIHFNTPDCLENYYQEAGRAGRDGKKAYAVLLYTSEDIHAPQALPDIRFPLMYDIRKVYQALADFLQVPVGIGAGNFYDFDLNDFIKNFKLEPHLVSAVLKVLEQEGHLFFNENIFLPSQVGFTASKEILDDFEQSHPASASLVKYLLRTYSGIYDNNVSVYEKQLAKMLHSSLPEVQKGLQQLQRFGIINYLPQKETPQICFLLNRAPAQFLHIDHTKYLQRKQQYELRLETMLQYLRPGTTCRSSFIAAYFGDENNTDCGICDNCLHQKNRALTEEEFKKIATQINNHIPETGIAVKDLLLTSKGINKEKFWKVLNYLQAEKMVHIDALGWVKSK